MKKVEVMGWNSDLKATLSLQKFILTFLGIWPLRKDSCFTDLRWTLVASVQLSALIVYLGELYLHCHGMRQSINYLTPAGAATLALVRLILPRVYRAKLTEIVSSMIEDWSIPKEEEVLQIMRQYARMSIRVTEFLLVLVFMIMSTFVSYAITGMRAIMKRDVIVGNLSFADDANRSRKSCVFKSLFAEQLFSILSALQMIFTGTLTTGTTGFFFGLVVHLCGQFDALGMRFARISEVDGKRIIGEIVRRHCHLERLAKNLEASFTISVLVYLFITAVLISVEGFLLIGSVKHGEPRETVRHTSILLLMLIQLSFYTFAGDCLQEKSNTFSYAAYNSKWYDLRPEPAKGLQIMLAKTMIPLELTAGKFITLDMVMFKDVLKTTGSYLSVLQVVMDE